MTIERSMPRYGLLWVTLTCAILVAAVMQYRHSTSRESLDLSLSALNHSVRARLHVARAYLIADRTRNDDPNFSRNDVDAELDRARLAVSDLLSGRPALLGTSRSFAVDASIREIAKAFAVDIDRFRALVVKSDPKEADAVSTRSKFSELEARADELDVRVVENIRAIERSETRSHAMTLAVVVALILSAGIALFVIANRREFARRDQLLNEQRLRLMLGQLPLVLWTTNSKLEYTSVSGSLGMIDSSDRDALVGTAVSDELPQPCPGRRGAHERALAGEDASMTDTFKGRHLTGRIRPLHDPSGTVVGTVGVAIDITERIRLESELRQAQRLESVGRLAAGVAHDFNNLMTIVMTNAEMLEESLGNNEYARGQVKQIFGAADRGVALTRQLLAFSRRQPQQRTHLDVSSVVTDLIPLIRTLVGSRIRIRVEAPPNLPTVLADRSQLEQVVLNLASNARDAMPRSGDLFLSVTHTDSGPPNRSGSSWIRLDARDTGTGIDPSIVSKVFDPFFTTKDEGRGTGLGLATVYGIADQTGGAVTVNSELSKGSTFSVWLPATGERKPDPIAAPADPTSNRTKPPHGRPKQLTILVADDDPGVREMMRLTFAQAGHRVLVAQDGEEAIAMFERDPRAIDLLVTDVRMPGMRGTALASRLRELSSDVRVLFVSGFSNDEDLDAMARFEGSALLHKPFSVRALANSVQRLAMEAPLPR